MNLKREWNHHNLKKEKNIEKVLKINSKIENKNKKVNNVRTELLLLIDDENNKYIKNCNVKLNNELPKEIVKKYSESMTVSFNNPIIMSERYESMQIWKSQKNLGQEERMNLKYKENSNVNCNYLNNNFIYAEKNLHNLNNFTNLSNNTKNAKSIQVLLFSKCIKEIGKDFIDQRKKNVGSNKLDKHSSCNKLNGQIQIDTDISFVEAFNNINTSKNKSKSTGRYKQDKTFKFHIKESYDDLFFDKKDKVEKNIQKNFKKLQDLVGKLKKPESDENSDTQSNFSATPVNQIKKYESFYKNFMYNFNDVIDNHHIRDSKKYEQIRDSKNSNTDNYFNSSNSDRKIKLNIQDESITQEQCIKLKPLPSGFKIRSTIYSKNENLNKEINNTTNNPFKFIKCDIKTKSNSLKGMDDAHRILTKNLFPERNFEDDDNNEYFDLILNSKVTTRNESPLKHKLNSPILFEEDNNEEEKELYNDNDNEQVLLNNIYSKEYPIPTPINKKNNHISYTYSSNKDLIDFLSDNETDHRGSNLSITYCALSNEKTEKNIGINTSDNQIVKLIKCKTSKAASSKNIKYDSEISKNSSETSRFSLLSKNKSLKSDYTMSYISEMTDEITDKIL